MKTSILSLAAILAVSGLSQPVQAADDTQAKLALCVAQTRALASCAGSASKQSYSPEAICKQRIAKAPATSLAAMKLQIAADMKAAPVATLDARSTALVSAGYPSAVKLKASRQAKATEATRVRNCAAQQLVQAKLIPQS